MASSLQDFQVSASDFQALENALPPSSNTGGNLVSPPLIAPLWCESDQKTVIDYLSFTSRCDSKLLYSLLTMFTPNLHMIVNKTGMLGYPFSANLVVANENIGVVGWGADHGRNLVSLSGAACRHWDAVKYEQVVECLVMAEARLTRVDIAFDTYFGEITYDSAEAALSLGEFSLKAGGRRPAVDRYHSSGNYGNKGRTLYVGSPKSSKRICIYEKGLEQFGKLPAVWLDQQTPETVVSHRLDGSQGVSGNPLVADWVRCEVRYSNKDMDLDGCRYAIIQDRDLFFAGAYPFCAKALSMGDGVRPPTLLNEVECTLERMKVAARDSYGGLVYAMKCAGYSDSEVVDAINSGKHSKRLLKSGVFSYLDTIIPF